MTEEDAFSRIFINLVDNALKFSRTVEQKVVVIGYRLANGGGSEEGEVVFFFRDHGPGTIATSVKSSSDCFGEDELTRTTPGTEIGLALVKELAAKMNAQVDLESKEPGVEFTVRFRR